MKRNENSRGFRKYVVDNYEAGINISWASILAGVITFLTILFTLSLISSAIGFEIFDPTKAHPLDNVGTGVLIWSVIAFVLSLLAGGFISGITARRMGFVHGFMTWATSVLIFLGLISYITAGAFSAVGSILGGTASVVGESTEFVASETSDLVSSSFDSIVDNVSDVDTDDLQAEVSEVLEDTDIPELQPDYLQNQLNEAMAEIGQAGKEIALDPDNADEIVSSTADSLQDRAENITESIDRDDIADAVAENTDLTDEEAQQATDNIYNEFQKASTQAQQQIQETSETIKEQEEKLDQKIQEARVKAEQASETTAKASIWAFVALVLGLIITSFGGYWGSHFVRGHNEEEM